MLCGQWKHGVEEPSQPSAENYLGIENGWIQLLSYLEPTIADIASVSGWWYEEEELRSELRRDQKTKSSTPD